jgi:hypothetical protein
MSHEDVDRALGVAKAGLRRFFDEGHYIWSKRDLNATLNGVDLSLPDVQEELKRWEKSGAVRLLGQEQAYLEVLSRIPD